MNRILILELVTALGFAAVQAAQKPNVLLILVDDLKPAMGCYGDNAAITPNLDALASRGMRFDMAYCNQAVCAPSRFTLMLGAHSTSVLATIQEYGFFQFPKHRSTKHAPK